MRNVTASFLFPLFGVNEQQRIVSCHKTSRLNICSGACFVTSWWWVHIFPFVLHSLDLQMWSSESWCSMRSVYFPSLVHDWGFYLFIYRSIYLFIYLEECFFDTKKNIYIWLTWSISIIVPSKVFSRLMLSVPGRDSGSTATLTRIECSFMMNEWMNLWTSFLTN